MRNRNGDRWRAGAAITVALILAGTLVACAETKNGQSGGQRTFTADQARSLLVPMDKQPEFVTSSGPMTLKQAGAEQVFGLPPGMVFEPRSCETYLQDVVGPLESLEGWLQFGSRSHVRHDDFFLQVAAIIPDGADLEKIRASAATCETGRLSLDNRVTGKVTFTERKALNLDGARSFSMTQMTEFSPEETREAKELMQKFHFLADACIAQTNVVAMDNLLILVMEANIDVSNELTESMYNAANAL